MLFCTLQPKTSYSTILQKMDYLQTTLKENRSCHFTSQAKAPYFTPKISNLANSLISVVLYNRTFLFVLNFSSGYLEIFTETVLINTIRQSAEIINSLLIDVFEIILQMQHVLYTVIISHQDLFYYNYSYSIIHIFLH